MNELTRSHTLELHPWTTHRNPATMYYGEGQIKSATFDHRRSAFNPMLESNTDAVPLMYDVKEVKAAPLLINTANSLSSNFVNFKSPTLSSKEAENLYTQTSPQGTQSIKSVGGNSSSSCGGFTQSQQNFQQNSTNNGEDAEFVSWVESSSLAGDRAVRTEYNGTMSLGGVGTRVSATSVDTDSIKSSNSKLIIWRSLVEGGWFISNKKKILK